jgi:hypothetical protein
MEEGDDIEENSVDKTDTAELLKGDLEGESDGDGNGWWTNSPDKRDRPLEVQKESNDSWNDSSSSSESSSSSSSSWSEDDKPQSPVQTESNDSESLPLSRNLHSASIVNLLEHENHHGLEVRTKGADVTKWASRPLTCLPEPSSFRPRLSKSNIPRSI